MHELACLGDVLMAAVAMAAGLGFPPYSSGAFWAIAACWGVVSVLFDDETPRGVPGLEVVREVIEHHEARKRGA
jgi:hypothetical protein